MADLIEKRKVDLDLDLREIVLIDLALRSYRNQNTLPLTNEMIDQLGVKISNSVDRY